MRLGVPVEKKMRWAAAAGHAGEANVARVDVQRTEAGKERRLDALTGAARPEPISATLNEPLLASRARRLKFMSNSFRPPSRTPRARARTGPAPRRRGCGRCSHRPTGGFLA